MDTQMLHPIETARATAINNSRQSTHTPCAPNVHARSRRDGVLLSWTRRAGVRSSKRAREGQNLALPLHDARALRNSSGAHASRAQNARAHASRAQNSTHHAPIVQPNIRREAPPVRRAETPHASAARRRRASQDIDAAVWRGQPKREGRGSTGASRGAVVAQPVGS